MSFAAADAEAEDGRGLTPETRRRCSVRGMRPLRLAPTTALLPALALFAGATALHPAPAHAQVRDRTHSPGAPHVMDSWFPHPPRVRTLRNGLTVIAVQWPSPGIVAYYTLVRAGSRDEVEAGHSGFAHFFEHMMFRGTERFPQERYDAALQSVGADNNAFTSNDYTCYTITGPSSALATFVELEADRFQHLSYTEEVFRTEAGAVRGEYQVWSSNPEQPMWEALSELAFTRHTYGHTTIGYLRDIDQMPTRYAYAQRFFQRFYTPDDATLIVVGDFDDATLDGLVDQHYGAWRGRRDQPRIPAEPPPTGGRRDLPWAGSSAPRMMIGYRIPAFVTGGQTSARTAAALRETAALDIVHGLAFDSASPLYQRLVVDDRSVLELSSWAGEHSRDPGLFVVLATLPPPPAAPTPALFDPTLQAIQDELDRIGRGETPPERITAVRDHLLFAAPMTLETPSSVAVFLAGQLAVGGTLDTVRAYYDALAAITPEDVARAAHTHLGASHRYVTTLREVHTEAPAPTGGAS
ncbi:MAG: insulinase family protein [Sandaracinaceae bacterium]|nr:insulinase family protein [Sandaracinaceae bacterium]